VKGAGLSGRAARASRSNLIAFPAIGASAFFAGVVVARTLPVSDFAVYALALALRGTVQFLADFGTGAASARAFAQLEAADRRGSALQLYGRLAAVRAGAAVLLAGASFAAADAALHYLGLAPTDRAALFCLVVMGAAEIAGGLGTYVLTGMLRQRQLNAVLFAYNVAQPTLVVAAALAGLGLTGILAALALASAGKTAALHVGAVRALQSIGAHGENGEGVARSLTKTAGAASLGKLATWAHSRPALSFFMLPAAGRADFAVFALGYDLAHQIMASAAAPVGNVMPAVAAKTAHDPARLRRIASPVVVALLTGSGGLALVACMGIPHLDGLLYGIQYDEMGQYLAILMPAIVLDVAIATPATAILLADDRLLGSFSTVRVLELGAAALYIVVGLDHLMAATAMMATVRAATAIALLLLVQQQLGSLLPPRWVARFCFTVVVAAAVGSAAGTTPAPDALRAVAAMVLGAVTFVLMVRRFRLLGDAELRLVMQVLPAASRVVEWLRRGASEDPRGAVSAG